MRCALHFNTTRAAVSSEIKCPGLTKTGLMQSSVVRTALAHTRPLLPFSSHASPPLCNVCSQLASTPSRVSPSTANNFFATPTVGMRRPN
jgi:hypothetical protein